MSKPKINHIVLAIHGIRDYGVWSEVIKAAFNESEGIEVKPIKYGYFPLWRFLAPPYLRSFFMRGPMKKVRKSFRAVYQQYGDSTKISVIAHSFGTFLLTQVLKENPDIRISRLIICGSVLSQNFEWDKVAHQIGEKPTSDYLINDCGNADHWPMIGKNAGWGFGDIGTNGAGTIEVTDRFHDGGHGLFFEQSFMSKYWVPFFVDGEMRSGDKKAREKVSGVWKFIAWIPFLNWLILLVVVLGLSGAVIGVGSSLFSFGASKYKESFKDLNDRLAEKMPGSQEYWADSIEYWSSVENAYGRSEEFIASVDKMLSLCNTSEFNRLTKLMCETKSEWLQNLVDKHSYQQNAKDKPDIIKEAELTFGNECVFEGKIDVFENENWSVSFSARGVTVNVESEGDGLLMWIERDWPKKKDNVELLRNRKFPPLEIHDLKIHFSISSGDYYLSIGPDSAGVSESSQSHETRAIAFKVPFFETPNKDVDLGVEVKGVGIRRVKFDGNFARRREFQRGNQYFNAGNFGMAKEEYDKIAGELESFPFLKSSILEAEYKSIRCELEGDGARSKFDELFGRLQRLTIARNFNEPYARYWATLAASDLLRLYSQSGSNTDNEERMQKTEVEDLARKYEMLMRELSVLEKYPESFLSSVSRDVVNGQMSLGHEPFSATLDRDRPQEVMTFLAKIDLFDGQFERLPSAFMELLYEFGNESSLEKKKELWGVTRLLLDKAKSSLETLGRSGDHRISMAQTYLAINGIRQLRQDKDCQLFAAMLLDQYRSLAAKHPFYALDIALIQGATEDREIKLDAHTEMLLDKFIGQYNIDTEIQSERTRYMQACLLKALNSIERRKTAENARIISSDDEKLFQNVWLVFQDQKLLDTNEASLTEYALQIMMVTIAVGLSEKIAVEEDESIQMVNGWSSTIRAITMGKIRHPGSIVGDRFLNFPAGREVAKSVVNKTFGKDDFRFEMAEKLVKGQWALHETSPQALLFSQALSTYCYSSTACEDYESQRKRFEEIGAVMRDVKNRLEGSRSKEIRSGKFLSWVKEAEKVWKGRSPKSLSKHLDGFGRLLSSGSKKALSPFIIELYKSRFNLKQIDGTTIDEIVREWIARELLSNTND